MRRHWVVGVIALAVLLGGCSTLESGTAVPLSGRDGGSTPPVTSSSAPLPKAADGSDVSACSDAQCEVSVGPGTAIPLPVSTGVRDVKVTTVTATRVTLTGADTGNSSFTTCLGQCDSNDTDGVFTVTLGPDSEDEQDQMSVLVKGFGGGRVVLRFDLIK